MPFSDRAFRALAREQPALVVELLRILAPAGLPLRPGISPDSVADPHLDPPPTLDADWIARMGSRDVIHVECQGYRDAGFGARLFRYHLSLVLRYPRRRVHTVALWIIPPPLKQRLYELSFRDVRCKVTSVVLCEIPAERLLAGRGTACFAAAADAGTLTDAELCDAIVRALQVSQASERERLLAAILAATCGRYDAMVGAMTRGGMEPVIIEDLVRFGEDRGVARGIAEGIEKGMEAGKLQACHALARTLLDMLTARGLDPTSEERTCIEAETSIERLGRWCGRAGVASSVAEILSR